MGEDCRNGPWQSHYGLRCTVRLASFSIVVATTRELLRFAPMLQCVANVQHN